MFGITFVDLGLVNFTGSLVDWLTLNCENAWCFHQFDKGKASESDGIWLSVDKIEELKVFWSGN